MNAEQILLKKWRTLTPDSQEKVLEFVEFLENGDRPSISSTTHTHSNKESKTRSNLGERLRKIRQEIVDSGIPLLTAEEVEREKAERRNG